MAITFLNSGGDEDFAVATTNGFWAAITGSPVVATDFVHGSHQKSIKYIPNATTFVGTPAASVSDSGTRISFYLYINALPSAIATIVRIRNASTVGIINIRLTSTGVVQLWDNLTAQIGSNGSTLAIGQWYRISLAYTLTSTSVNRLELFKNGSSDISVTNATLTNVGTDNVLFGNVAGISLIDIRSSDHYIDNSSSLTDTGDIWVTAKRPFSNGTTNGFTTQVGSGGSAYGTGHALQVNERPLSTTNGWAVTSAGSAITEEYNIEPKQTGDINLNNATIIDYMGWVSAKSALSETASIVVNNASSNISLTSTNAIFTKVAGSATYPAGTGTDIGIITSTTVTTVTLNECGIIIAYIPGISTTSPLALALPRVY